MVAHRMSNLVHLKGHFSRQLDLGADKTERLHLTRKHNSCKVKTKRAAARRQKMVGIVKGLSSPASLDARVYSGRKL